MINLISFNLLKMLLAKVKIEYSLSKLFAQIYADNAFI